MDRNLSLSLAFLKGHLLDAVRILEQLSTQETAAFLEHVPAPQAAEVCRVMDSYFAAGCLKIMKDERVAETLSKQSVQTATVLLRLIDDPKLSSVLQLLPDETTTALTVKMRFPEYSAGAMMNPQALTLFEDQNVREAARQILKNPKRVSFHLFVLNRDRNLLGAITIPDLMLGEPNQRMASIMQTGIVTVSPYLELPVLLDHRGWHDFRELPVVDESGAFLGTISYQTVRESESLSKAKHPTQPAADVGAALGELYWIGLSALFRGAASTVKIEK